MQQSKTLGGFSPPLMPAVTPPVVTTGGCAAQCGGPVDLAGEHLTVIRRTAGSAEMVHLHTGCWTVASARVPEILATMATLSASRPWGVNR